MNGTCLYTVSEFEEVGMLLVPEKTINWLTSLRGYANPAFNNAGCKPSDADITSPELHCLLFCHAGYSYFELKLCTNLSLPGC